MEYTLDNARMYVGTYIEDDQEFVFMFYSWVDPIDPEITFDTEILTVYGIQNGNKGF